MNIVWILFLSFCLGSSSYTIEQPKLERKSVYSHDAERIAQTDLLNYEKVLRGACRELEIQTLKKTIVGCKM